MDLNPFHAKFLACQVLNLNILLHGTLMEEHVMQVVLLLRLSPLVPYGLLNYMLGLTEVSLPLYIGCSWLGMLPGAL